MSADFVDDLLKAVERVFSSDWTYLKEIIIISGTPEKTQNLRYLSYNRKVLTKGASKTAFSAVALINNRGAEEWLLKGYARKISQFVFSPLWTSSKVDLFLNALRCSPDVIACIATAGAPYSLFGILEVEDPPDSGIFKHWSRRIRPILAIPGLDDKGMEIITAFEKANEVRKSTRI